MLRHSAQAERVMLDTLAQRSKVVIAETDSGADEGDFASYLTTRSKIQLYTERPLFQLNIPTQLEQSKITRVEINVHTKDVVQGTIKLSEPISCGTNSFGLNGFWRYFTG